MFSRLLLASTTICASTDIVAFLFFTDGGVPLRSFT
jgi:hypothetical protein